MKYLTAFVALAFPMSALNAADDRPIVKPNIVLFLVDDMGWMDSSPYGSQYYETPNMPANACSWPINTLQLWPIRHVWRLFDPKWTQRTGADKIGAWNIEIQSVSHTVND